MTLIHTLDSLGPGIRPVNSSDLNPSRMRDVVGRLKVSMHENVYEADFEYGPQPLRWETFTAGGGTATHLPGSGGVRMAVDTANGSMVIRQSRPYHRYQPGKTMFMASAVQFGSAETNNVQRVGFFDDSNGVFFEQGAATAANLRGIYAVIRSDSSGVVTDTRVGLDAFNCDELLKKTIDWARIQMIWIEYAWYGAGALRWGVFLNGEPYILHQYGHGNTVGAIAPWARTGNLPVRYESRNIGNCEPTNPLRRISPGGGRN